MSDQENQHQPAEWQPQSYQLHHPQTPGGIYPTYPMQLYPGHPASYQGAPYDLQYVQDTAPIPDAPPPAYDEVYQVPPHVVQQGYHHEATPHPEQEQRRPVDKSSISNETISNDSTSDEPTVQERPPLIQTGYRQEAPPTQQQQQQRQRRPSDTSSTSKETISNDSTSDDRSVQERPPLTQTGYFQEAPPTQQQQQQRQRRPSDTSSTSTDTTLNGSTSDDRSVQERPLRQTGYRQEAAPTQQQQQQRQRKPSDAASTSTYTTSSDSNSDESSTEESARGPRLRPLPEELTSALRAGAIFGFGLTIIGGVGIQYRIFGFRSGAGIWAGLLAVCAFVMCAETRRGSPEEHRRSSYIAINVLACLSAIFFICWHAYGMSAEKTLYDICTFRNYGKVESCNGTESNVLLTVPGDKSEIEARLVIQGVGTVLAAFIILIFTGTRIKISELSNSNSVGPMENSSS